MIWKKEITTDLIYKELIPKFYVIRDRSEKIVIRFQSEEDAALFNQSIKEILTKQKFQEFEYKIIPGPTQNVSPDSSDNENSEDETEVPVSSDGINNCYHEEGKLPPAPPILPSKLMISDGGYPIEVETNESSKNISSTSEDDMKSILIREVEKFRPSKRPDSDITMISSSTVRDTSIWPDYKTTDWK